jgi:hypothetical protein
MQSWGKVSSIPSANTLFKGRQTQIEDRERTMRGQTEKDERTGRERRDTEIKITEKRSKDRSETRHHRVITHCKREIVMTTSEVVNKEVLTNRTVSSVT